MTGTLARFEHADTVARKGYQCAECHRNIRNGEPFRRRRVQWAVHPDGDTIGQWKNYPLCNDCMGIEHDMLLEPTDYLPGGLFERCRAEAKGAGPKRKETRNWESGWTTTRSRPRGSR